MLARLTSLKRLYKHKIEAEVYCSTYESETGVDGAWEGVKRGEGLRSLCLGRGIPNLPHDIRKVLKGVILTYKVGEAWLIERLWAEVRNQNSSETSVAPWA